MKIATKISDLKNLDMSVIDGVATDLVFTYAEDHIYGKVPRDFNLANVRQVLLSKYVTDARFNLKEEAYQITNEQIDLTEIARYQNDIFALIGKMQTQQYVINGVPKTVEVGFVATQTITGGTYINGIGTTQFASCRIQSEYDDYPFFQSVIPISELR